MATSTGRDLVVKRFGVLSKGELALKTDHFLSKAGVGVRSDSVKRHLRQTPP